MNNLKLAKKWLERFKNKHLSPFDQITIETWVNPAVEDFAKYLDTKEGKK
jgi:hypothetical protein